MIIRPATVADVEVLAALHALCFAAPWSASELATLLATPGASALMAEDAESPAGWVMIRRAADEAEVLTLAIAPGHRRRGVGRALLRAACASATAQGAGRMLLEVAGDNAAAARLYASERFEAVGTRPAYYVRAGGGAADAVVLSRPLNRAGA
ncbi:MAG TPA: GNAT family N-acetyltransferase [Caulobacteraceae bacterium]|nr:GNAT family N-acetyltransferase [Caulobacteraceae bacterium]